MKRKNKRMRLPNGFGQISKLSGRLRKPYRAMITVGFTEEGRPICKILKPVGYFETYNEEYAALLENSKTPYDRAKEYTLEDMYNKWSEEKYQELAHESIKQFRCAWNKIKCCGDRKFADLRPLDLEEIIKISNPTPAYIRFIKVVLSGMYEYAMRNDIVSTNYARMVHINKSDRYQPVNGHVAFTNDELKTLWANSEFKIIKLILIQIYTGMRPRELISIKPENIHLDKNYMVGGSKTAAGKNRIIPIHPCIKSFVSEYSSLVKPYKFYEYYLKDFNKALEDYKIDKHTPHDCRKTFVTLAKEYNVNEYAIKRIVGHAISDLTENVYTERSTGWLLEEISKIKCRSKCRNNV